MPMPATSKVDVIGNVGNDVYYLLVVSEFESFLREIAKAHGFANIEFPAIRFHQSEQHFDKGRFSSTVVAYNAHFFEAGKVVIKIFEYGFRFEGF